MKKFSWSKQLLIAGSIMTVAFACQCQKKADVQEVAPAATEQSEPVQDDDNCDQMNSSDESEEECQLEDAETVAPVVEQTPAAPAEPATVVAPEMTEPEPEGVTEVKAEAPKLEAVSAVSEERAPISAPTQN